ncbi:GNAT family N-acetyltransferase [Pseudomonas bohemica]|uniref:GNAT family N-acetyltransferase n=1 Tax=Pseudomonas bohemica TaxID=2044872 RepID=UPI000DA617BF|nr:GNAT family N-acetyltransferase [Pseudomonas bohemica]
MKLVVKPLSEEEHALFRVIYSLYLHDLSEFTDFYQLSDEGQWLPDYLDTWLSPNQPNVHPFLFWLNDAPVGMALVGASPFPHMSPDADYRISEFFIARGYRKKGIGRAAAKRLFEIFPGKWEIVQLEKNYNAVAFWASVVREFTAGQFASDLVDGEVRQTFNQPTGLSDVSL